MAMIRCDELTRLAAEDGLGDLPLRRRMEVRLHLLLCPPCKRYLLQLQSIGDALRRVAGRPQVLSDGPAPPGGDHRPADGDDPAIADLETRILGDRGPA